MARSSRSTKTLTINRSRDIVVDRLVKQCVDGNHSKCTGWAVLRKENSPINANYFIKCICSCHKKGARAKTKLAKRTVAKAPKRKAKTKKVRKAKRARRR